MKKIMLALPVLLVLGFGLVHHAWAQPGDTYYEYPSYPDQPADSELLSWQELDDLLAPIALYPDPLIAQILPASTFVDQIDQAARFLRQYGVNVNVDGMPWDVSVKAVAHYPDVLYMMDQRYEWTVSLGQAYIEQPQDVMDAIQRLRADAMAQGNLYSTPQWQVIIDNGLISIVPATPQYVYVPVYDPNVVYIQPYDPGFPFITFGAGFVIGAWLDRDCDWHHHRVYYHGWRGRGWIARSRPHIRDRRGVYINPRLATVNVNRDVTRHDTSDFRQQLREDAFRRREGRPVNRPPRPGAVRTPEAGRPGAPARRPGAPTPAPSRAPEGTRPGTPGAGRERMPETGQQRPPEGVRRPSAPSALPVPAGQPATSRPAAQPPAATGSRPAPSGGHRAAPATVTPATPATPVAPPTAGQAATPARHAPVMRPPGSSRPEAPANSDVYRGRDVQRTQPASQSGFGGYGTSRDATIYRERGQSSRQNMQQPAVTTPAPKPSFSAPRPAAPAARPAPVAPRAAPAAAPRPAPAASRPAPVAPRAAPAAPAGQPMRR
ncbi:MAG TPA: DUF3300 domain-containing protein [Geomonas sp.]|nr:DUF3300 domain-containing protein [Geomonas sp.]